MTVSRRVYNPDYTSIGNEYNVDLALGLIEDKDKYQKFGMNDAVPNGAWADLWAYGPTLAVYPWPDTLEAFRIKAGGNAADTAAGANARSVWIEVLDGNWDRKNFVLATAGASASASSTITGYRFLRAYIVDVGAYGVKNLGDILIEHVTSGDIVGTIEAAAGQTQQTHFTVPRGYTALLTRMNVQAAVGTNKDADIIFWQRPRANVLAAPFGGSRVVHKFLGLSGSDNLPFNALRKFDEYTDLWLEAYGNAGVARVESNYDLKLVKN